MILEERQIKNIKGNFVIQSYQRGYRWSEEAVTLVKDILEIEKDSSLKYCLQPVVVKHTDKDTYELIDGQQRLTTLYILNKLLMDSANTDDIIAYEINYAIRIKSKDFLKNVGQTIDDSNIDFYFMSSAYQLMKQFIKNYAPRFEKDTCRNIAHYLIHNVYIIWYEVNDNDGFDVDPIKLFQRLNIGKIPLTSSELVKALFLSDSNHISYTKKQEIALQWDNIEKELHDENFWLFLTNDKSDNEYQTRIDLLLDLYAKVNKSKAKDKYETFYFFDNKRKELRKEQKGLDEIWKEVQRNFLILKDWFHKSYLYHKIGYLITVNSSLLDIFSHAQVMKKDDFNKYLDELIKDSIKSRDPISEWSYESNAEYDHLKRLLILYNVIWSMNKAKSDDESKSSLWFPFNVFKKGNWSLEHIHAQNSQGLNTTEVRKEWIKLHINSVRRLNNDNKALIEEMELKSSVSFDLNKEIFEELFLKVVNVLTPIGGTGYLHNISNLALLSGGDNSAISNSTFDVKRDMIIAKEKQGEYIPSCTRNVFLKYYSDSNDTQLHFWGQEDRNAYIKDINETLKQYLDSPIEFNEGGNE